MMIDPQPMQVLAPIPQVSEVTGFSDFESNPYYREFGRSVVISHKRMQEDHSRMRKIHRSVEKV